jgi:hypothetical protein
MDRRAMIGAGLLLVLVGIFGLFNAWEALQIWNWLSSHPPQCCPIWWPQAIIPIEAIVVALPSLGFGLLLIRGRRQVVPQAAVWTIACGSITVLAILRGFPLLGGNAPAFSPVDIGIGPNPFEFQISVFTWLQNRASGYRLELIPAAAVYMPAAMLLVYLWRRLPRDLPAGRGERRGHGLARPGGLLLEALGFANIYGGMLLIKIWWVSWAGNLQGVFLAWALAATFGLVLGIAMVIGGHRVRTESRTIPGIGTAVASLVVFGAVIGFLPVLATNAPKSLDLDTVVYAIAPLTTPPMWLWGIGEQALLYQALTVAAAGILYALAAPLILAPACGPPARIARRS